MPDQFHHSEDVLSRLIAWQKAGANCALAIVTAVAGGSMRGPGALMAVRADGSRAGYISNGCVDGDIAARAQNAMSDADNYALRYGEGSSFRDIVLPCGGSIDVLIVARPDACAIQTLHAKLSCRESIRAYADAARGLSLKPYAPAFSHLFQPKLRLQVAGRGPAMGALASQAAAAGITVNASSPDADDLDRLTGVETRVLIPEIPAFDGGDAWTAVAIMFHDHDWEPPLLFAALETPAFFIGAMGSRKTHAARLDRLRAAGVTEAQLSRIHGPVGLVSSLRDANLVAISTLAHIIAIAKEAGKL